MVVPLPYTFQNYVIYAAASCASEDVYEQQSLMAKAQEALGREIDKLVEQGQRMPTYRTGFPRRRYHDWATDLSPVITNPPTLPPPSIVTTLTDICQDPWGNIQTEQIGGAMQEGITNLVQDQDYIDITFPNPIVDLLGTPTSAWEPTELQVTYPTDPPPEKINAMILVAKTPTGFRLYLNSGPPNGNFTLNWKVVLRL